MVPFYEDDHTKLYCADVRDPALAGLLDGQAAAVVTSPPYNVGVDYHGADDTLPWPDYWSLATDTAGLMARALAPGGRAWVNTAVSVPAPSIVGTTSGAGKARVMLAYRWANALEAAGLDLVDQVAWCSARGAGTAWGSWSSPAAPNLRGD